MFSPIIRSSLFLLGLLPGFVLAADSNGDIAFFENKIRPILVEHCYECHSEEAGERKGGLLLDRESGWMEGGNLGKAVVPGNLGASLLIQAVHYKDEDLEMPPKEQLSPDQIRLLEIWVKRGAPGPKVEIAASEFSRLGDQEYIFDQAKSHWAFQPLDQVEVPKAKHPFATTPIDQFVVSKLEAQGLKPSRQADRRTLVRRLYYSLTGLPPSPEQVAEFVENPKITVDEVVDELLASPHFGEHFARMWLDVARYADTANSYRADTKTPDYYPFAFTYRDYVIQSFNQDKPYDQFIKEQLAADFLHKGENAPELAALGFLGLSPINTDNRDFVDDLIDTTTRGFMGLTVSCARCHDHKFEPVPTADYYSLYGVFASIDRPKPWDVDHLQKVPGYSPNAKLVADFETKRSEIDAKIKKAKKDKAQELQETELAELLLYHEGGPAYAMNVIEKAKPVNPRVFLRGDPSIRGGEGVPRQFLRLLDPEQQPFPKDNSGRLELANHIADPENPLTARVFVNRIWGALMGGYIVDTPSDFGLEGSDPTHPELLDWLAMDFIAHDWSLKHLVRTIVASHTWQQSSALKEDQQEVAEDPENRLYWRANRQRVKIEVLRDSLLAVSGQLDPTPLGRPGPLWGPEATHRRSIYGYIDRFNLDPTLSSFGFPSPAQTQGQRPETTVPQQELFFLNSPFVWDCAQKTYQKLAFSGEDNRQDRVNGLYQQILQRDAHPIEFERISKFIDVEKDRPGATWPLVTQSLLMSNEFQFVD